MNPRSPRVVHVMRRHGEFSQTFLADAMLETDRLGWQAWVACQRPRINRDVFPFPEDQRVLSPVRPPTGRIALNRALGRNRRRRTSDWWAPAIHQARADIVHLHFGWMAAEIGLRGLGAPALVSFHGSDVTAWPWRRPENLRAYQELFAEIDRATATSQFIAGKLRALGFEGRIDMLPAGVRLEAFPYRDPLPPEATLRLVFVGRQVECKGLDVLLRALPSVDPGGADVRLDVIGDGPELEGNQHLARSLGLGEKVTFHGAQPREAVVAALGRAHALVAPSRQTKAGEAEGSPVITKEALAIGVPVVGTTVGGLPETIPPEYRHELVPQEEPEQLANAIEALWDNQDTWVLRARTGRAWVEEEFDWTRLGRRTAGIYADITGVGAELAA